MSFISDSESKSGVYQSNESVTKGDKDLLKEKPPSKLLLYEPPIVVTKEEVKSAKCSKKSQLNIKHDSNMTTE